MSLIIICVSIPLKGYIASAGHAYQQRSCNYQVFHRLKDSRRSVPPSRCAVLHHYLQVMELV